MVRASHVQQQELALPRLITRKYSENSFSFIATYILTKRGPNTSAISLQPASCSSDSSELLGNW